METVISHKTIVPVGKIALEGELIVPEKATGIVIFSHGSGSSRFSPRNNMVANILRKHNIGTFLFDLLTPEESAVYETRFDIQLLTKRLIAATRWISEQKETEHLNIGYFGASTGAAAALAGAAKLTAKIKAVVSRGGRPDLAMPVLKNVMAPVMLIVGGLDSPVIPVNRKAFYCLNSVKKLVIVPGASHLFEEKGKLEDAAEISAKWFEEYL